MKCLLAKQIYVMHLQPGKVSNDVGSEPMALDFGSVPMRGSANTARCIWTRLVVPGTDERRAMRVRQPP